MKHITILVPNGENNLSSIVGAFKILTRANQYWQQQNQRQLFSIQLAGSSKTVAFYDDLFLVKPHVDISAISKTDLIIIPSLNHNYRQSIVDNLPIANWIIKQHRQGAQIASICTGGFLLASTGLLEGKSCSTHWSAFNDFKQMFPNVNLKTDDLITDENGICTNGGAYSFLNLIIYLVEKYFDRTTAIYCAKVFQIEMDRNAQSQFIIFSGQKKHDDQVVHQAQDYIEKNLDSKFTIEDLSAMFHVGRRNFDRRFFKATGNTPIQYAQRVKIEAAKKAFETNKKTILEVMFDVGYSDVKAFREIFRRITGMSPVEYKQKYYKNLSLSA